MRNLDYVSQILYHFVGNSNKKQTEDDQYDCLKKIITVDYTLYANHGKPNEENFAYISPRNQGENNGEIFDYCSAVCFCDIPGDKLNRIHTNKYGHFGIGFDKSFLISQGTRPVMYFPKGCKNSFIGNNDSTTPDEYYLNKAREISYLNISLGLFDINIDKYDQISEAISESPQLSDLQDYINIIDDFKRMRNVVDDINKAWLTECAFIKTYDETLSEEDDNNYYMEREWRCIRDVKFTSKDIRVIYFPNDKYKERFEKEFPEYSDRTKILE